MHRIFFSVDRRKDLLGYLQRILNVILRNNPFLNIEMFGCLAWSDVRPDILNIRPDIPNIRPEIPNIRPDIQ